VLAFSQVLVAEEVTVVNEMYFAILLDRATAGPVSATTGACLLLSAGLHLPAVAAGAAGAVVAGL